MPSIAKIHQQLLDHLLKLRKTESGLFLCPVNVATKIGFLKATGFSATTTMLLLICGMVVTGKNE
ncbi:MAG TPA: hypothetical protein VHA56_22105 [Mucilaginibacter sp.]|nr:hypothetical protein [Mucilaginibacter sp.]